MTERIPTSEKVSKLNTAERKRVYVSADELAEAEQLLRRPDASVAQVGPEEPLVIERQTIHRITVDPRFAQMGMQLDRYLPPEAFVEESEPYPYPSPNLDSDSTQMHELVPVANGLSYRPERGVLYLGPAPVEYQPSYDEIIGQDESTPTPALTSKTRPTSLVPYDDGNQRSEAGVKTKKERRRLLPRPVWHVVLGACAIGGAYFYGSDIFESASEAGKEKEAISFELVATIFQDIKDGDE